MERLTRGRKRSEAFMALLAIIGLILGSFYLPPSISASSAQNTCISIGGEPCGYTGHFTGEYYAGYATLGCTPTDPYSPCAVPQIVVVSSFLVISNAPYVIDWANQSFRWGNALADGKTISVSGSLAPVFYNKAAGSTFMIYASNAKGVWNPQPRLQIQNATLTTHSTGSVTTQSQSFGSTCTTTWIFTVSGPPNAVWNLPMVPAGACITVRNMAQPQSYTDGNADTIPLIVLISSVGAMGLTIFCTLIFMKTRRKE